MKDFRNATISNNFMFRLVMEKPELCRQLLERILDTQISKIVYPEAEKSLEAQLTSKGIRLDIYVTLEDGTVIDVEMQAADSTKDTLAKRTRYYQSILDNDALKKGELYSKLRQTIIIFICTFDPFNRNFSRYTFSSRCHEEYKLSLEDGVYKIFLNTYGDKHRISRELANFMDYMNGSEPNDDFTRRLQAEVELQRDDDGRRMLYMTYSQTLLEMEAKGIEQGIKQGFKQGIEQGIEAGMLKTLRDLVKDGMLSPAEAAKRAGMSIEEFGKSVSKL